MAWIQLEQTLPRHAKTTRLMVYLKLPEAQRAAVVGHLACFWLWALDFGDEKTGDLGDIGAAEIAAAAGWAKDPQVFTDALVKAKWLDRVEDAAPLLDGDGARYRVHNWPKYMGRLMEQRESNRERQAIYRERAKLKRRNELATLQAENANLAAEKPATYGKHNATPTPHVTVTEGVTSPVTNALTVQNTTQQNQTNKQKAFGEAAVSETGSHTTAAAAPPKAQIAQNLNGNGSKAEGGKQNAETGIPEFQNTAGTAGADRSARKPDDSASVEAAERPQPERRTAPGVAKPAPAGSAARETHEAAAANHAGDSAGDRARPAARTGDTSTNGGSGKDFGRPRDSANKPAAGAAGLNRDFFDTLGYALRMSGGDGDARRLLGWLIAERPYAQSPFDVLVLARYLAAKTGTRRAKDPILDAAAYTIAWCENSDASERSREPYENFMNDANQALKSARTRMGDSLVVKKRNTDFIDALVKAWTKDAKPKEAAGVGA